MSAPFPGRTPADVALYRSLFCRVSDAYGEMLPRGPYAHRSSPSDQDIQAHLAGTRLLGFYLVDKDGYADKGIVDVDVPKDRLDDPAAWAEAREKVRSITAVLSRHRIEFYVVPSRRRGWHVYIHANAPVPASLIRRFLRAIVKQARVANVEIFPKQDARGGEDGLGNFVFGPLHGRAAAQGRTVIVDHENGLDPVPDSWEVLAGIKGNSMETLSAVLAIIEERESTVVPPPRAAAGDPLSQGFLAAVMEKCAAVDRLRWKATEEGHLLHEERIAFANLLSAFEGGRELVHSTFRHLSDYDAGETDYQFDSLVRKPPLCSTLCPAGQCEAIKTIGKKKNSPIAFAHQARREEQKIQANVVPEGEIPVPLFTRRAADVAILPVEWIWNQRLPLGKLVTVAGEPGLGKTRVGIAIASTMSRGGYWPQGEGRCSRGEVLILNFEDDHSDTTVPRLMAEGADLSLIHFLVAVPDEKGTRTFDLSRDTERLSSFLDQHPLVRLVIIDPITACMIGVDSHKNAEVRSALHPLAEVAQRHRVCIVAITHLNKGSGMKAMHRVTGSIAFTAAARVVFLVTKDHADPDGSRNLFLPIKNNLGDDRTGLSFRTEVVRITPDIEAPKIIWGDTVMVSADDALTPADDGKDALKDATAFLSSLLADGPLPAGQVFDDAKDAGVGVRALKAAKLKLKVQSRKVGMAGPWEWSLPGATEKMMFGDLLK